MRFKITSGNVDEPERYILGTATTATRLPPTSRPDLHLYVEPDDSATDAEIRAFCDQPSTRPDLWPVALLAETIPGARAVYACTEHDDCREHPEIGVACWRERTTRRTTR